MTAPILSIVIPTAYRPQYLPRAIASALEASPNGDVEVIVVPNGPDTSWRGTAELFKDETRVLWHPISTAHANAARNHGLSLARGKYIRFLDDDDYLFPTAKMQVEELEKIGGEFCSGRVLNIDDQGNTLGIVPTPQTTDFVIASTKISGFTLPTGNLFLRHTLTGLCWNVSVNRAQDNVWMLALASAREWDWQPLDEVVGVWFQHGQQRLSTVVVSRDNPSHVVDALQRLWNALNSTSRLSHKRSTAISEALWNYVHGRFPFRPFYWHHVAKLATQIAPSARPNHPIFDRWPCRSLPPLLIEWGLYPVRRTTTFYRDFKHDLLGRDYRRQL